jgi:hypothetical protein
MLDAIFGICRVCGNRPSNTTAISECEPLLHPALLMSGKIDPFGILPSRCTPKDHKLIYHCRSRHYWRAFPIGFHSCRLLKSLNKSHQHADTANSCHTPLHTPNINPLPVLHQPTLAYHSNLKPHPLQCNPICLFHASCGIRRETRYYRSFMVQG